MNAAGTCAQLPDGTCHLPIKILGASRSNLEVWGWRFAERCSVNPDWWHAFQPKGWRKGEEYLLPQSTTTLVVFIDDEMRVRLQVYINANEQAPPYADVVSFITLLSIINPLRGVTTIRVLGGGEVLKIFQQDQGTTTQNDLEQQAKAWCAEYYPDWNNPFAYWQ